MKFKICCLLPHLNFQSTHVAIGNKVGHHCSKTTIHAHVDLQFNRLFGVRSGTIITRQTTILTMGTSIIVSTTGIIN